jgi:hypothetical protein
MLFTTTIFAAFCFTIFTLIKIKANSVQLVYSQKIEEINTHAKTMPTSNTPEKKYFKESTQNSHAKNMPTLNALQKKYIKEINIARQEQEIFITDEPTWLQVNV